MKHKYRFLQIAYRRDDIGVWVNLGIIYYPDNKKAMTKKIDFESHNGLKCFTSRGYREFAERVVDSIFTKLSILDNYKNDDDTLKVIHGGEGITNNHEKTFKHICGTYL